MKALELSNILKIIVVGVLLYDRIDFYSTNFKTDDLESLQREETYINLFNYNIIYDKQLPHQLNRFNEKLAVGKSKYNVLTYALYDISMIATAGLMMKSNASIYPIVLMFDFLLRAYNLTLIEFEAFEKLKEDKEAAAIAYKIITRLYAILFGRSLLNFATSIVRIISDFKYIFIQLASFLLLMFIMVFRLMSYLQEDDDDDEELKNKASDDKIKKE
jgi:hypothetical protein